MGVADKETIGPGDLEVNSYRSELWKLENRETKIQVRVKVVRILALNQHTTHVILQ